MGLRLICHGTATVCGSGCLPCDRPSKCAGDVALWPEGVNYRKVLCEGTSDLPVTRSSRSRRACRSAQGRRGLLLCFEFDGTPRADRGLLRVYDTVFHEDQTACTILVFALGGPAPCGGNPEVTAFSTSLPARSAARRSEAVDLPTTAQSANRTASTR